MNRLSFIPSRVTPKPFIRPFACSTSPLFHQPSLLFTQSYRFQHFGNDVGPGVENKSYTVFPSRENTKRLLVYMWPPGRPDIKVRVAGAVGLMVATKFLAVSVPVMFKSIVDLLSPDAAIALAAFNPFGFSALSFAIAYGIVKITQNIVQELRYAIFMNVSQKASNEIGVLVFRTLLGQDITFHIMRRTGGLSRQVDRGMRGVSTVFHILLFNLIPTLIELVLVCAVLHSSMGPAISLTAFSAVGLYIVFTYVVTEWRSKFRVEMNALDTRSSTILVDSLMNYEAVRLNNNADYEIDRYSKVLDGYFVHSARVTWSLAFLNFGQGLIFSVAIAAVTIMSIGGIQSGVMTIGDLVMVNALMVQLSMPLNFLGTMYRELTQSSIDMQGLFDLLNQKPTMNEDACVPYVFKGGKIEFKNVTFSYPYAKDSAGMLRNVSFVIQPGQVVGLVGPTAAGKSTTLRLLSKFYIPQQGQVLLDDQDLSSLSSSSIRERVGTVTQDSVLFNETIRYNISYGRLNATEEEIITAAKSAAVHDAVLALDNKYDTLVGERGVRLSGGERQRIGLARVLLKQPNILLADEATSALDNRTEAQVMKSLKAPGRTVLLVAHRLSTIMDADVIIVFREGTVHEMGTHAELLAKNGLYAEMWYKQQKEPKKEEKKE
eukprot:PhF_6_TR27350/c0_g1_i1/m.40195/K05663/ABC.ATM; mitochondrial ABC transporter ATM